MKKDLPADPQASHAPVPLSAARARTLDRMQRLIGLAALGAAACSSASSASSSGYAVVDPMPTPARCPGGSDSIHGTAAFEVGPDGKKTLVIRLAPPTDPGFTYAPPSTGDPPYQIEAGGIELRMDVPTTQRYVTTQVSITCAAGPAHVGVTVNWPEGEIAPGTPLIVDITPSAM